MLLSDMGMRTLSNHNYVERSWDLLYNFHTLSEKYHKKSKLGKRDSTLSVSIINETFRIGLQSSLSQLLTNVLKADPKHKGAKKLKSDMYVMLMILLLSCIYCYH